MTRPSRGFTLLELTLVVVILSVLFGILVVHYSEYVERSKANAAADTVRTVRSLIRKHTAEAGIPASIQSDWYGGTLRNAWFENHPNTTLTVDSPTQLYPTEKRLTESGPHAHWYNRGNGRFHALVPQQATAAETVALFNRVNKTELTALGQTE